MQKSRDTFVSIIQSILMRRMDKSSDLNFNNRFYKVNFVGDYLSEIQIPFA